MKTNYLKIAISVASVALIAIYTYFLYLYGGESLEWQDYIIQAILVCGGSALLALSYKFLKPKNRTFWYCLNAVVLILMIYAISTLTGKTISFNIQMLMLAIFPILCYWLVKKLFQYNINENILMFVYNIVVVVFIWLMQEVIIKKSYFAADVVAEIYMYAIAEIALLTYIIKHKSFKFNTRSIVSFALTNIVVLFVFLRQERVVEIIHSLNYNLSDVGIEGDLKNWLALRGGMLKSSICGDFTVVNPHYMQSLVRGCSLAWLSGVGGWYVGVSIVLLEIVFVASMLIYSKRTQNALVLIISLSFVLKLVIGVLANMFLVFSTNIGLPFIGIAIDAIAIFVVIMLKNE